MPKIPADFTKWTPPWKEGEIDEDKVARLVYNLQFSEQEKTDEIRTLKTENADLTSANEVFKTASDKAKDEHSTEVQKAVAEAEAARDKAVADLETEKRRNDLLEVRVKFPKIDEEDIDRLKGKNLDELLADAEKFAEKHGLVDADETDEEREAREEQEANEDINVRRDVKTKRTPGDPRPTARDSSADLQKVLDRRAAQISSIGG